MLAILQSLCHGHGHLLLLRTKFKIAGLGKNSAGRKNLFDLRNQVRARRLLFDDRNHFSGALFSVTHKAEVIPGASEILFCFTLPDSTQTICLCSAGSKSSGSFCVVHGFQTTVEFEPAFSTRIVRFRFSSRISTMPAVS